MPICVELVAELAVGAVGVPVKAALLVSALLFTAVCMASNSSSISVPFTILFALPVDNASFAAKSVVFE